MAPEIEKELLKFIREQAASDIAGTLRRIVDKMSAHEHEDVTRHAEVMNEIKRHSFRIGALERSDEKLESRVEQSGSWDREAMQSELLRARSVLPTWIPIVAAVFSCLTGAAALIVALFSMFRK